MSGLPTGTFTFLFTDVEGSTKLWERGPEAMSQALVRHDELLREAVGLCRGTQRAREHPSERKLGRSLGRCPESSLWPPLAAHLRRRRQCSIPDPCCRPPQGTLSRRLTAVLIRVDPAADSQRGRTS